MIPFGFLGSSHSNLMLVAEVTMAFNLYGGPGTRK